MYITNYICLYFLEGGHQRNFPEITEMLLTLTNAIFECKLDAVNDWTMDSIISLLMALPKYEVKKVCMIKMLKTLLTLLRSLLKQYIWLLKH